MASYVKAKVVGSRAISWDKRSMDWIFKVKVRLGATREVLLASSAGFNSAADGLIALSAAWL